MGLQARAEIFGQDLRDTSTVQQNPLGFKAETVDGRIYRYALAGAADLDPGKLTVTATPQANHNNMVTAAAPVGATEVTVTLGGTAVTADEYAEGLLNVTDLTGEGILYRVAGHAAQATTTGDVVIKLAEPIKVALDSTSQTTLMKNKFKDVVISATDQADVPTGVPNVTIDDADYGWLQTGGDCSVWGDEVVAVGDNVTIGDTTAGQVSVVNADSEPLVGVCREASVPGEYTVIDLKMD